MPAVPSLNTDTAPPAAPGPPLPAARPSSSASGPPQAAAPTGGAPAAPAAGSPASQPTGAPAGSSGNGPTASASGTQPAAAVLPASVGRYVITVRNGATLRGAPQVDLVPVETFELALHNRVLASVDLAIRHQVTAEVAVALLSIGDPTVPKAAPAHLRTDPPTPQSQPAPQAQP
eukprot:6297870-Alexandrium_andersonii.AAC.1